MHVNKETEFFLIAERLKYFDFLCIFMTKDNIDKITSTKIRLMQMAKKWPKIPYQLPPQNLPFLSRRTSFNTWFVTFYSCDRLGKQNSP